MKELIIKSASTCKVPRKLNVNKSMLLMRCEDMANLNHDPFPNATLYEPVHVIVIGEYLVLTAVVEGWHEFIRTGFPFALGLTVLTVCRVSFDAGKNELTFIARVQIGEWVHPEKAVAEYRRQLAAANSGPP